MWSYRFQCLPQIPPTRQGALQPVTPLHLQPTAIAQLNPHALDDGVDQLPALGLVRLDDTQHVLLGRLGYLFDAEVFIHARQHVGAFGFKAVTSPYTRFRLFQPWARLGPSFAHAHAVSGTDLR
jgi:hypothetical protein